jgi:hypothetical protein
MSLYRDNGGAALTALHLPDKPRRLLGDHLCGRRAGNRMAAPPGKPLVPTPQDMDALRDVAHHRKVLPQMHRVLKNMGLIEQRLGSWTLTQAGQIRLQKGTR